MKFLKVSNLDISKKTPPVSQAQGASVTALEQASAMRPRSNGQVNPVSIVTICVTSPVESLGSSTIRKVKMSLICQLEHRKSPQLQFLKNVPAPLLPQTHFRSRSVPAEHPEPIHSPSYTRPAQSVSCAGNHRHSQPH